MSALDDLIEIVKSRPELDHDDVVAQATMYAETELSALRSEIKRLKEQVHILSINNIEVNNEADFKDAEIERLEKELDAYKRIQIGKLMLDVGFFKTEIERLKALLKEGLDIVKCDAAEIKRLKAERTWQPIETAPKDATIINLLAKHPYIGYYAKGYGFLVYLRGWWTKNTVNDEPITHWMSLPQPPEEE